ncbi:cylicin-2-like isoform X2 [Linepithema humile]|uniref:cylicin-2-like isoform X2 n=1 Tax=Linepithema humile TaxID=83485 RepID=UPI00351DD06A
MDDFTCHDDFKFSNKSSSRNKCCTTLPNVLTGDFDFVRGNNKVAIDKTDYRDRVSKIFSTQENEAPIIDLKIEQARTNNSSACITAKNINNFSPIESKFKKTNEQHSEDQFKPQDNQFSQRQNLPQSSELQFRNVKRQDFRYIPKDLFLNTMKQRSQQQTIVYFTSSRNQGSRKLSSCLTSMPRRVFSTKSCTVIQKSIRITSRKDLNVSSIRLKSTRSHSGALKIPDCVSPAKLQSFSHDASKSEKFDGNHRRSDLKTTERNTRSEEAKNRCEESNVKIHKKNRSQQEDTRNKRNVSSQSDISKKQRKNESESCERYLCPELQRKLKCRKEQRPDDKNTHQNCDSKGRDATKNHARQSKDFKYSQKQDIGRICVKQPQLQTCERHKTSEEARVVCTDPSKGKNDCSREKHEIRKKERQKCTENNRGQSKNQKRDFSYDKNKTDGKRHYSQQSIFSVSGDHRSFSTLIPDIVLGTNGARKTTQKFYASCSKDEKDLKLSCEKPKKKCDTDKKDEAKKKCVKDPPKCLTKKSIADKKQTCLSTSNDKDMKLHEPTQKSRHEEYCSNRKKAMRVNEDKKPKEVPTKKHPPSIAKDKQPKIEKSIREQIDREYREIDECKKSGTIKKDDKKDDKVKKMSTEYRSSDSDRVIIPYEQQEKDNEKFTIMPNQSIVWNSTGAIHKSLRGIHDGVSIIARDVRLFDMMFDRSFSTTKVNYQDDFAIEQTAGHSKMVQRCSANNSEFIHGDELPSYIEVENDEEEDDEYDWVTGPPILGLD